MSSSEAAFRSRNKLKRPVDFHKVFSSKQRSADKQFLFLANSNKLDYARLGLAVPKRHINSAVKRNRVKRVIREAFRLQQTKFVGMDLMVMVRGPINNMSLEEFNSALCSHWKSINQCKPC